MMEGNLASGTPSLIKVNSEYDIFIIYCNSFQHCSSIRRFNTCKTYLLNFILFLRKYLLNFCKLQCTDEVMMTGYSADKSTGDVAADQYHHYKVSVEN